jgi:hypothetical protein
VENLDRPFATNVRVPFSLLQQLLQLMTDGSGITILAFVTARVAVGNLAAYAASRGRRRWRGPCRPGAGDVKQSRPCEAGVREIGIQKAGISRP